MEVIKINDLKKTFKIYMDKPTTLKEKVLHLKSKSYKNVDIINGISLTIKQGQMVGLIGHNGSGKSTLLKLITKIIYPDSGDIEIKGRVSSLLELGAGFHPDFTGIENIYMNASLFGLTKKEISTKIDKIISFSELDAFLFNPVRTYSSGMYMRLAFAIAINIEPDILLVDEVLAVGDASFQRKCLNRIKELKNSGKTIVLVTHDHGVVERLCDRAIWIHDGMIKKDGRPNDVVNDYLMYLAEKDEAIAKKEHELDTLETSATTVINESNENKSTSITSEQTVDLLSVSGKRWGNEKVKIIDVEVKDLENRQHIFSDSSILIKVSYEINENFIAKSKVVFGFAIYTIDRVRVYGTNTQLESIDTKNISLLGEVTITFPTINLIEGDYLIDIAAHDDTGEMFDYFTGAAKIRVLSKVHDVGYCRIPHKWSFEEASK